MVDPPNEQEIHDQRIDQVVKLSIQGHRDKDIAQRLGVKVTTVRTYWERLYARSGQTHRTAAVAAYIRDEYEAKLQALRGDNSALQRSHEASRKAMTGILMDVQERLAEAEEKSRQIDFFDRASAIAHAAMYELDSVNPVCYRFLSPSASQLGMDVEAFLQGDNTFYKHVEPDDLPLLYEVSLGAQWLPNERYIFLYRMRMPEPRWVLDTHQALYNDNGEFESIVGIAIDIHDLVLAGLIIPSVNRVVISGSS